MMCWGLILFLTGVTVNSRDFTLSMNGIWGGSGLSFELMRVLLLEEEREEEDWEEEDWEGVEEEGEEEGCFFLLFLALFLLSFFLALSFPMAGGRMERAGASGVRGGLDGRRID